jgi:hypothetical protein
MTDNKDENDVMKTSISDATTYLLNRCIPVRKGGLILTGGQAWTGDDNNDDKMMTTTTTTTTTPMTMTQE